MPLYEDYFCGTSDTEYKPCTAAICLSTTEPRSSVLFTVELWHPGSDWHIVGTLRVFVVCQQSRDNDSTHLAGVPEDEGQYEPRLLVAALLTGGSIFHHFNNQHSHARAQAKPGQRQWAATTVQTTRATLSSDTHGPQGIPGILWILPWTASCLFLAYMCIHQTPIPTKLPTARKCR